MLIIKLITAKIKLWFASRKFKKVCESKGVNLDINDEETMKMLVFFSTHPGLLENLQKAQAEGNQEEIDRISQSIYEYASKFI